VSASGRTVGLRECFEDQVALLFRYPDTGIGYVKTESNLTISHGFGLDSNDYFAAVRKLDRISGEVDQNLPHPSGITNDYVRRRRRDMTGELQSFLAGPERQQVGGFVHCVSNAEIYILQPKLACLDLRKVENVIEQI